MSLTDEIYTELMDGLEKGYIAPIFIVAGFFTKQPGAKVATDTSNTDRITPKLRLLIECAT